MSSLSYSDIEKEDAAPEQHLTLSQRLLGLVRESQAKLAGAVAFSALLTSLQPQVESKSAVAGAVFEAIATFAALVTVVSGLLAGFAKALESARAVEQYAQTLPFGLSRDDPEEQPVQSNPAPAS